MTASCEACGDAVTEADAVLVEEPGATLVFCPSCTAPSYAEEIGVRR